MKVFMKYRGFTAFFGAFSVAAIGTISLLTASVNPFGETERDVSNLSEVSATVATPSPPWTPSQQRQRELAVERSDRSLLPICPQEYFDWREATKHLRQDTGPTTMHWWEAPGCRVVPDGAIWGVPSLPGPRFPLIGPDVPSPRPPMPPPSESYLNKGFWAEWLPPMIGEFKVLYTFAAVSLDEGVDCPLTPLVKLQPFSAYEHPSATAEDRQSAIDYIRSFDGTPSDVTVGFADRSQTRDETVVEMIAKEEEALASWCKPVKFGAYLVVQSPTPERSSP